MFRDHPTKRFSVKFWDGSEVRWQNTPEITVVFRDSDAFCHALRMRDPSVFAEAYVTGRIDIQGDVAAALDLAT